MTDNNDSLHRYLGLPLLVFYGLGTIIGAGIYVLVGEVARVSGELLPWTFLLAGAAAALTGACYAELCSAHPRAAGAVLYVDEAFARPGLSRVTGLLVLATGIVSAATISRGFVGYLDLYWQVPAWIPILMLCAAMGVIASVGIRESAWVITLITLVEVAGLLLVIALVSGEGEPVQQEVPAAGWNGLVLGCFLAFYAFIGFEDMVNLAEESRQPERDLPRAILLAIAGALVLYGLVAVCAVRYVPLAELGSSGSPLAMMVQQQRWALDVISLIGLVAISNGALTQVVMASRMLYGMGQRRLLPPLFAHISKRTRTPVLNTWLVVAVIAAFAIFLPLVTLAKLTSAVMLVVFILVNLSTLRLRRTGPRAPFRVWGPIPWLGLLANSALLAWQVVYQF